MFGIEDQDHAAMLESPQERTLASLEREAQDDRCEHHEQLRTQAAEAWRGQSIFRTETQNLPIAALPSRPDIGHDLGRIPLWPWPDDVDVPAMRFFSQQAPCGGDRRHPRATRS